MKSSLFFCLLLGIIAVGANTEKSYWEDNPKEFLEDAWTVLKGVALGLHLERLAPSIKICANSLVQAYLAFVEFIKETKKKDKSFYTLADLLTLALGFLSPACRKCVIVPEDAWAHLIEDYFKKFDFKWEKYLQGSLLNMGYRLDEVAEKVIDIMKQLKLKDLLRAGFYSGEIINLLVNVTSPNPIPEPPPISTQDLVFDYSPLSDEVTPLKITWDEFHTYFQRYFNYSMISLNYTKWINATTANNLNESTWKIELSVYKGVKELMNPKPNIREAVLTFTDIFQFLNQLFRGVYFTIEQIPKKVWKDTVFEHLDYLYLNLLQHSGYFIWNGWKLYEDIRDSKYLDMIRRITTILRKFLYFDEDVLDDILSGVTVEDI